MNRVDPILLIDRLAQQDRPAPVALFEEIIEPPAANDVARHAFEDAARVDLHLSLRDRTRALELDRCAAEEVTTDATPAPILARIGDKILGAALAPGRMHPSA